MTIHHGDNLAFMESLPPESVDLICADPPYNTGRDFGAYNDRWDDGLDGYLEFMKPRLIQMHRVMAKTGSIYLQCDDNASHYLKVMMDDIWGRKNFRNELIWRRAASHNNSSRYGVITDSILYYAKSDKHRVWNGSDILTPKTPEQMQAAYPFTENGAAMRPENITGLAGVSDITGPGPSGVQPITGAGGGESSNPWHGYDVASRGRHWAPPKVSSYAKYIEENFIPGYMSIEGVHDRLDALDAAGLIHHPASGAWPGLKKYAVADPGNMPQNLILKPMGFTNYSNEGGLYRTQKPVALYELFIKASSNPGDLVLDPFCGSGTTLVAAKKLGRDYMGIDQNEDAVRITNERLASPIQGQMI